MTSALRSRAPIPAGERLDLLAAAPLPYRSGGREHFQLGGCLYCAALLDGLDELGHRVEALASAPRFSEDVHPEPNGSGVRVEWFALVLLTSVTLQWRK
jgi:hypothetical protein